MQFRGLDKNFVLLAEVPAVEMEWRRRYEEYGCYEARLYANDYDPAIEYIWNTITNEVGIIEVRELITNDEGTFIHIKGYFIESWLSRGGAPFISGTTPINISTGCADMIRNYVISGSNGGAGESLISIGNIKTTSKKAVFDAEDDQEAGIICQKRLKKVDYSQRLRFDYENTKFYYDIWQGVDRSIEGPNFCVFSDSLGNISEVNYSFDGSNYKNFAFIRIDRGNDRFITHSYDWRKTGERKRVLNMTFQDSESSTDTEARTAAENEAILQLLDRRNIESITFEPMVEWFEYMKDYDLGDKIFLVIVSLELSATFRIIGVDESYENGNRTVELHFGDMKKANYQRRW